MREGGFGWYAHWNGIKRIVYTSCKPCSCLQIQGFFLLKKLLKWDRLKYSGVYTCLASWIAVRVPMSHVLESRFSGKCKALVPLIAGGVVTLVGVVTEVDVVTAGGVVTALCDESC